MLGLLDTGSLTVALGAIGAVIVGWFIAYIKGRGDGKSSANQDAMENDYENADAIRDRVDRDRAKRVRELDDAGYRD